MRALGILLIATLVGCIFVVSPEEYGTVCRFQGEETQCGACVAAKCRREIDDCCRDASCDDVMASLDRCTASHGEECVSLKNSQAPLSSCVARECGPQCERLTGQSTTSCREPRLGEGSACTCTSGDDVNDVVCNPRVFPQTICCAPEAWPATGLECKCEALDCRASPDGCFCKLADFTPKQRTCEAVHCCVSEDVCRCTSEQCSGFERPVTSCSIAELGCAKGQKRVDSCSARTP